MATIKTRKTKDGKTRYYVQIRLKGHEAQCANFDRVTDAKKWIQETEVSIREGRHFKTNEAKKRTFGEMIEKYMVSVLPTKPKCIQRQGAQLKWWQEQIGHKVLADVTPSLIGDLRDKLLSETTVRKKQRAPATVVRYLAALSHAFTVCVREWEWLEDSPMRKVTKPREPRGRVRFLSSEEREALLNACKQSSNEYLYIIVVTALSTAMRRAEILKLSWPLVFTKEGRIILEEQKNGERSSIPLSGHALELIKRLEKTRRIDTQLLFPSNENPKKPIDIRFPWEKALKASGVKNFSFHCLRHSAASYLAAMGCSLIEIQKILRHKSISQTVRYSHLAETHTADVIARMNEEIFG
ncbi:MAG: Tyrosine recombinase XerD [Chlamydiae bacterium]|nr:Tyrosine recombinase XerD [Chlamydiota bacterium]